MMTLPIVYSETYDLYDGGTASEGYMSILKRFLETFVLSFLFTEVNLLKTKIKRSVPMLA